MADPTTILIVDDEPIVRAVLENLLARPDRLLIIAADGEEALKRAETATSIDVALVDKNLPGMSGLQVVRTLKARHPDVAGIIMTAYPTTESAAEAVRLGRFDYLSKPFDKLADVENAAHARRTASGATSRNRIDWRCSRCAAPCRRRSPAPPPTIS